MSERYEAAQRAQAVAIYQLRKSGHTNKEIARIQSVDVKRVPTLVRLGETLSTLKGTP